MLRLINSYRVISPQFKAAQPARIGYKGTNYLCSYKIFFNLLKLLKLTIMKKIDDLIRLTPEQESLVKEMEELYLRMEKADIAFTMNESGFLVAYNSKEIEDCEFGLFGCPDGFECADPNEMREIFPFWDHDEIYLRRK